MCCGQRVELARLTGHSSKVLHLYAFRKSVWSCGWDTKILIWDASVRRQRIVVTALPCSVASLLTTLLRATYAEPCASGYARRLPPRLHQLGARELPRRARLVGMDRLVRPGGHMAIGESAPRAMGGAERLSNAASTWKSSAAFVRYDDDVRSYIHDQHAESNRNHVGDDRSLDRIRSVLVLSPRLRTNSEHEIVEVEEQHEVEILPSPSHEHHGAQATRMLKPEKLQNQSSAELISRGLSVLLTNMAAKPNEMEIRYHKPLGRGFLGTVYLGCWHDNYVAAKVLHTRRITPTIMEHLREALKAAEFVNHPNLVLYMGACKDEDAPAISTRLVSAVVPAMRA